jgi:hypothetical protein
MQAGKGDEAALRAFAVNLGAGGDSDAIARATFARVRIDSAWNYQNEADWRYGNYLQRHGLLGRLLDRVRRDAATSTTTEADRRLYARAALALAAQDSMPLGGRALKDLLDSPQLLQAAGLGDADLAGARAVVARHDETNKAFAPLMIRSKTALTAPPESQTSTRATAAAIVDSLRAMAPLTRDRPDLQYHLASLTWLYSSRARASGDAFVAEVTAAVNSPHFDRWMQQSAGLPPPAARPVEKITHAELAKFRNISRELRDRLHRSPPAGTD